MGQGREVAEDSVTKTRPGSGPPGIVPLVLPLLLSPGWQHPWAAATVRPFQPQSVNPTPTGLETRRPAGQQRAQCVSMGCF